MARPRGSSNKNKDFLLNRLKDMYGDDFDPVMQMAKNAHEIQKAVDAPNSEVEHNRMDAINAWDKVAQYTTPKLKSLEIDAHHTAETFEEWLARQKQQDKT